MRVSFLGELFMFRVVMVCDSVIVCVCVSVCVNSERQTMDNCEEC